MRIFPDKNSNEDRLILKKVCVFNNSLKCHPLSAYNLATGKTTETTDSSKNFFEFVDKVCAKCPTYLFIKDRGIPK